MKIMLLSEKLINMLFKLLSILFKTFVMKQFASFLFLILSFPMSAQEFQKEIFVSKSDTLPYNILVPVSFSKSFVNTSEYLQNNNKYPLIIFLHGSGERGTDNEIQINHINDLFTDSSNREKYPAFVVAPQCPPDKRRAESDWRKFTNYKNSSTPSELTIELINELSKKYPIDNRRVYITGLSMGGAGTWDLICRYPGKFAAAVPICGFGNTRKAGVLKSTPIWAFHGSDDKVVKVNYSRDMVNAVKKQNEIIKYTEYKGVGHDSWVKAYKEKDLLDWLFKQTL